jgi:WD40 repeat protein
VSPTDDLRCPACGTLIHVAAKAALATTGGGAASSGSTGVRTTVPRADSPSVPDVTAAPAAFAPSVAGYEVLGELGRGGMGIVYRARHTALKRLVAIKMIRLGAYAGPEEIKRFLTEAAAVARLQHPNIVQIYEVGEADGLRYFSLELVEGGNLQALLAQSPLAPVEAARLVETLARAMHYAHSRGIIHRDLKPANVLLSPLPDGEKEAGARGIGVPKITDFGLAKQLDDDSVQTQTGAVMGTPSYMAPEQAAGRTAEVGPQTDVYALGAILYDCLTGRPPFKGASIRETLDQVCTAEPLAPSRLQPKCPRDLETICLTCLHKDAARRYASAEALADDLRRFLEGRPIQARPVGRLERTVRWCRRYPAVAGLLVLLALALAGAADGWGTAASERDATDLQRRAAVEASGKEKDQRRKTEEALGEVRKQKGIAERATEEAKSKQTLAETSAKQERAARKKMEQALNHACVLLADQYWVNGNATLAEQKLQECPEELRGWEWRYLARLTRGNVRILEGHAAGVPSLAFSADGRRLASVSRDDVVRVWDVAGGKELYASPKQGTPRLGTDNPTVALSRDGRFVLVPIPYTGPKFTPEWEVAIVHDVTAGKDACALKAPPGTRATRLIFSPDGKQVAGACETFQERLRIWDAATGRLIRVLPGNPRQVKDLAFSPDGKLLASVGIDTNKGDLKVWDLATGKETFAHTTQTHDNLTAVVFSPDGKHLAICGHALSYPQKGILKLWETAAWKERDGLPAPPGPVTGLAFSPVGELLAVDFHDGTAWVLDLKDGTMVLKITGMAGTGTIYPQLFSFSPDGKRLAVSGSYNVRAWDLRTKDLVQDLRGHPSAVLAVAFSPDGRFIASGGDDHTVRLWDVKTAQGPLVLRDGANTIDCSAISPDGEFIATAGHAPTGIIAGQVKLWKTATGEIVRTLPEHTDMVRGLAFSPDGTLLAVAVGQGGVILWDVATGKERLTFRGHDARPGQAIGGATAVAFGPDGKQAASTGNDGTLQVWNVEDGKVVFRWEVQGKQPRFGRSVAFSKDGKRLVVAFYHEMRVFALPAGQTVCIIPHDLYAGGGNPLALSPDGSLLASVCLLGPALTPQDATAVRLWDAASGKLVSELRGHLSTVAGLAFSSDGQRLASASGDGTVKLWDVQARQDMLTLRGSRSFAHGLAFSKDGNRLLSTHALYTGTLQPGPSEVRVWDARPLAGRRP